MIVLPPPADMSNVDIVESHVHSGSSTSEAALKQWIEGGDYVKPTFETRDNVQFQLPDGETVSAGDTVAKATNVTISIGLTPLINDNIEQALARADGALYEAKNKGRNIILAS